MTAMVGPQVQADTAPKSGAHVTSPERAVEARSPRRASAGRLLFAFLLCLYLITGGGKGYSIDGAFGYEMAKSAFLDPQHTYFHRFKTAFARWGALLPLLGQPFVLAGDALSRVAPERDDLVVAGHRFRVEEWPALGADGRPSYAPPVPERRLASVTAIGLVSFLSDSVAVPHGTVVGEVRLRGAGNTVALPIRAGVDTAEWALERPDVRARVQHGKPAVAGHWIGQPRGNLYFTTLALPTPMPVDGWELASIGSPATWHVRAVAFEDGGAWVDVHTGERFWSARQTRDFFTRLIYSTLNAFTTAGTALLVYFIVGRFGYAISTRVIAALGFGAATMAWAYAKLDFSEPASTFFALLAVWAFYRTFPPRVPPLALSPSRPLAAGLVAAAGLLLAVAGKYTAALLGGALACQWALSSGWWHALERRRALAFLGAFAVPAAVLGAAVIVAGFRYTGEVPVVLADWRERLFENWLALPLWTGLRGLVFSPGRSLFLYSPWLLLALPGAVLFFRRHRATGALVVAYPLVMVLLFAMKLVWHGGAWGPRYLLPAVPFLAITTAPAIAWCLARGRRQRIALAALAAVSVCVQVLAIAKDPERYPAIVREFVVPALPDYGSAFGGRDYWLARGGPGLSRALVDPAGSGRLRGLGYLWGYPNAELRVDVRRPQTFELSLYFVDWDRQARRQTVEVEDALGRRRFELDRDFGDGIWATWQVTVTPEQPLRVSLAQRGQDTAVVSAAAFDPARGERRAAPLLDDRTKGNWRGVYGADGYVLFAWRSFNVDVQSLPAYATRYDVSHVGDNPDPRNHVEIAEQDLLDTPLLYALHFSPLLGNAWLLAADLAHLVLPGRPDVAAAILARPPWTWFGIHVPPLAHPEYGLGLDFWPTLLYTNYASFPGVLVTLFVVLLLLETALLATTAALLRRFAPARPASRWPLLGALAVCLALYTWLQVQA
ncbi:MAG: hypothetical protein HY332_02045 [Chloroflexi bacterium]|nr:hypothetical protein [Chloroflexota bacterium]